eukprot:TRINITY_DN21002_c0_g1_i1.p1 TRINITY_DN21002_c0_g1~~TRINITY_DN21002_c0_g1_i1.p1  ORF type:complete len:964 (-),score=133.51 TRINITY_DN21002_c0_g1_i1:976-3732(-)
MASIQLVWAVPETRMNGSGRLLSSEKYRPGEMQTTSVLYPSPQLTFPVMLSSAKPFGFLHHTAFSQFQGTHHDTSRPWPTAGTTPLLHLPPASPARTRNDRAIRLASTCTTPHISQSRLRQAPFGTKRTITCHSSHIDNVEGKDTAGRFGRADYFDKVPGAKKDGEFQQRELTSHGGDGGDHGGEGGGDGNGGDGGDGFWAGFGRGNHDGNSSDNSSYLFFAAFASRPSSEESSREIGYETRERERGGEAREWAPSEDTLNLGLDSDVSEANTSSKNRGRLLHLPFASLSAGGGLPIVASDSPVFQGETEGSSGSGDLSDGTSASDGSSANSTNIGTGKGAASLSASGTAERSPGSGTSASGSSSGSSRSEGEAKQPLDHVIGFVANLVYSVFGPPKKADPQQTTPHRVGGLNSGAIADISREVLRRLDTRLGGESFARRSETNSLRRLQREAFSELLALRERIQKLELHTGLRRMGAGSGAGPDGFGARTRLSGEVAAGTAFVPTDSENSESWRRALEQAGMRSGLRVKLQFETPCREGGDTLLTECVAGLGEASSAVMLGGPITLSKVLYTAQMMPGMLLRIAPLGARGWDMTEPLNPLQEGGLTRFSSEGAPLHGAASGSGVGFFLRGTSMALAGAQFLSGWGVTPPMHAADEGGLCASTIAQLSVRPHARLQLAFSALNRMWPAPHLPSKGSLHWSELGPLVLPKFQLFPSRRTSAAGTSSGAVGGIGGSGSSGGSGEASDGSGGAISANGDHSADVIERDYLPDTSDPNAEFRSLGHSLQSVSCAAAFHIDNVTTMSAWVQADHAKDMAEDEKQKMHWAVLLLHQPPRGRSPIGWGLSVGSGPPRPLLDDDGEGMMHGGEDEEGPLPTTDVVQLEAFLRIRCGRGLSLQPGVVVAADGQNVHHAFMLRTTWAL